MILTQVARHPVSPADLEPVSLLPSLADQSPRKDCNVIATNSFRVRHRPRATRCPAHLGARQNAGVDNAVREGRPWIPSRDVHSPFNPSHSLESSGIPVRLMIHSVLSRLSPRATLRCSPVPMHCGREPEDCPASAARMHHHAEADQPQRFARDLPGPNAIRSRVARRR